MANKEYRPRVADQLLQKKLKQVGAVLVQGPKWCGKTSTAEQCAKSVLFLDDPSQIEQNLQMAENKTHLLLEGNTPRLIDEWQLAPKIWDAVRFTVDHRHGVGQFILTGSAVPADNSTIHHSGVGRFAWLTMRPMSLWESGDSDGRVSLGNLFESPQDIEGYSKLSIVEMAHLTCRGGWPGIFAIDKDEQLSLAQNYYDGVVNSDLQRAMHTRFSAEKVSRLMRSYARNLASQASIPTILNDMQIAENDTVSIGAVNQYLDALRSIFVIEDAPAWNPNLRSKTAIRTTDTRYFVDPSIATAALGLGPKDLLNDLHTFGLFFENLAVRDLRVYADALGGKVYHYRDKDKLECDAVIHLRDGRYGLVEVKLGGETLINEGIKTLNKLTAKLDTALMREPSFRMVLTANNMYPYRRKEDGIYVVPLACLKD